MDFQFCRGCYGEHGGKDSPEFTDTSQSCSSTLSPSSSCPRPWDRDNIVQMPQGWNARLGWPWVPSSPGEPLPSLPSGTARTQLLPLLSGPGPGCPLPQLQELHQPVPTGVHLASGRPLLNPHAASCRSTPLPRTRMVLQSFRQNTSSNTELLRILVQ